MIQMGATSRSGPAHCRRRAGPAPLGAMEGSERLPAAYSPASTIVRSTIQQSTDQRAFQVDAEVATGDAGNHLGGGPRRSVRPGA